MTPKHDFDIAILGSGIAGSMLGAILSKQGLNVLLIDAGSHPRFSIGEATTPDTSGLFKLLALKYEVPEIAHLATFYDLKKHIGPSVGVKRSFSFVYHREGQEQNPKESHQFPTLAPPLGPDCHLFRQDTDAYMLSVALKYGAEVKQQTKVETIDFEEEVVKLTTTKGETIQVAFVVDAAGFRSPLAQKFDLREDASEVLETNSRAIFTHMVDVKLYDQVAPTEEYGLEYPLSQGTLHHVFEGGWFWVIPFNNHLESTNSLCSVGLLLNRNRYPETGMDAEEEFFSFANRFPAVKRQFAEAKAARNWISTGKIQYSSKHLSGHRYALLSHAAAFVDPLFSSGLNLTSRSIDLLVPLLLESFKTNDFNVDRFQPITENFKSNVEHYDQVISRAFSSFPDYDLWDAWYRVWVAGNFAGTAINTTRYFNYLFSKDKDWLIGKNELYSGVLGSKFSPHKQLFDQAKKEIDAVEKEGVPPAEAAKKIRALFDTPTYIPGYYHWGAPDSRTTPTFTVLQALKMQIWYRFKAEKETHKTLFGWPVLKAFFYVMGSIRKNNKVARKQRRIYRRDVFKGWNTDWKT